MTLSIQIAEFKFRQYQLRAFLPNLMLAKVIPAIQYTRNAIRVKTWAKHEISM